jgi:hypothetical protein
LVTAQADIIGLHVMSGFMRLRVSYG